MSTVALPPSQKSTSFQSNHNNQQSSSGATALISKQSLSPVRSDATATGFLSSFVWTPISSLASSLLGSSEHNSNVDLAKQPKPAAPQQSTPAAAPQQQQAKSDGNTSPQQQTNAPRTGNFEIARTADGKSTLVVSKEQNKQRSTAGWFSNIVERFGVDAGKTFSDQLKDPLDRLARSPVIRTGEVLVVHSLDMDSLRLKKIMYYMGALFLWIKFVSSFFGRLSDRRRQAMLKALPMLAPPMAIQAPQAPSTHVQSQNSTSKRRWFRRSGK